MDRYEAAVPSATCNVRTKNTGALCYERVLSSCGDERERETEREEWAFECATAEIQ